MVSITDVLKEQKAKIDSANKLRLKVVEEKRMRDLDEANAWTQTDFKAAGATTDKLRKAVVQRKMNTMPNVYARKKAELENLEAEIDLNKKLIDVMMKLGVDSIDLEEDKDKGDGS